VGRGRSVRLSRARAWLQADGPIWGRYLAGIVVSAAGTVTTLRADLGFSPWDVLHDGLSRRAHVSFGQAVMAVSVIVVLASWAVGIRPRIATVFNTVLMGWFDDRFLGTQIGASLGAQPVELRFIVLLAGIVLIGVGAAIYIGAGLGAGPRDSMQLALSKRMHLGAGWARALLEGVALGVGWLLGGTAGIGTLVFVLAIGGAVGLAFALLRVDAAGRRFPLDEASAA
jgi:uncharacterized membrane protein YczE